MKYWRGLTVLTIVTALLMIVFLSLKSTPAARASAVVGAPADVADALSPLVTATIPAAVSSEKPLLSQPVSPTLSKAVRDLPLAAPDQSATPAGRRPPIGMMADAQSNIVAEEDPLLRSSGLNQGETPTPSLTFEGLGNSCACSPP